MPRMAAAALAVCLASAASAGAAEVFVTVSTTSNTYSPSVVFIQPGDTVTWTFAGGPMPHNVQADDGSYQSPVLGSPWTFSHTFPAAGTSRYYCVLHGGPGGTGMAGIVFIGAREAWAPQDIVQTIHAWDFSARVAPGAWGSSAAVPFHRTGSAAGETLVAGLDVPAGSRITGLELSGCDNGAGTLTARLFQCLDPELACIPIAAVVASGTPPCAFTGATVPNVVVNNLWNSYAVEVEMGASQSLRAVRVFYRKAVSPPPATATFADVPTTDSRFRFVEALVAAGVTGGCGGGNYCPESPVTRGQMAVFIAAALGLYWPN